MLADRAPNNRPSCARPRLQMMRREHEGCADGAASWPWRQGGRREDDHSGGAARLTRSGADPEQTAGRAERPAVDTIKETAT